MKKQGRRRTKGSQSSLTSGWGRKKEGGRRREKKKSVQRTGGKKKKNKEEILKSRGKLKKVLPPSVRIISGERSSGRRSYSGSKVQFFSMKAAYCGEGE